MVILMVYLRHTVIVVLLVVLLGGLSSFREFRREADLALTNYERESAQGVPTYPAVERALRSVQGSAGDEGAITFLTGHVQRFREDPNNGYYLSLVGAMYQDQGASGLARQYYRRALLSYPDVAVRSVPVHRVAINRLLELVDAPDERIDYLRYLQRNYPDNIDHGLTSYYLGKAYEAEGRWGEAFESYRIFLQFPETRVPGEPHAAEQTRRRLAFYDSRRDWTHRELETLVENIKRSLWSQSPASLLKERAGENFFTMSWEQEPDDENSAIPTFDIAAFLRRSRVRYADELDISSNANEAYLRTWGWSHRIPTWYLYFRRVDFPADPEIHGNWEWAGIYFGESRW
jgi:tetratricopeptide (TPR) repeat protein